MKSTLAEARLRSYRPVALALGAMLALDLLSSGGIGRTATAAEAQPAAAASTQTPATAAVQPGPGAAVVAAARAALADGAATAKDARDDVAALVAVYATLQEPVWTKAGAYTDKAKAAIAEFGRAADWGLEPAAFAVPELAPAAEAAAQGAAEARLMLAMLRYARYARGGRISPIALSNIFDMKPPLADPKAVLAALMASAAPDATLRGYHPRHPGFERLRQALIKHRGPHVEEKVDPALLVKLPDGKSLKPGAEDDQISLLRQRLKIPAASPEAERRYDEALVAAVKAFQTANKLKANGLLGNVTRKALNKAGEPKDTRETAEDRLIANMERWRWLPAELGDFYVMNNIPEYHSEIWKGNELKLRQKMIVGKPAWPTPILSATMQYVIFHPTWGVPPGILRKELQPRIKRVAAKDSTTSSGPNILEQLFGVSSGGSAGGGNAAGAKELKRQNLEVTLNGKKIDPETVDWATVDMRRYGFTQPAGVSNPLGMVKFRFPNSHNVYMHDTPNRGLFGQSFRALSHGCMRVGEPRQTAEVILAQDKGWPVEKVSSLWKSGGSVTLDRPIPVHLVYFTARVGDDGQLAVYPDIYGNDARVMSALRGKAVRYVANEALDPSEF